MMSDASPGRMPVPGFRQAYSPGEQRVARRRAGRRAAVAVGEPQAFLREPVDVRRLDRGRAVAAEVAVAEVVGVDQDDVRRRGLGGPCSERRQTGDNEQ